MIYTITLNPAIDTIINVSGKLAKGRNNRIIDKLTDVGGKGTHVSIGLSLLGVENKCLGITGATYSDDFIELLQEFNVDTDFLLIEDESTRQNIVVTDDAKDGSFLISEIGVTLNKEIIETFVEEKLKNATKEDYIVVSGNPSQTTSVEVFDYFLTKIQELGSTLIVDVSGDYLHAAFAKKIELIKPNQYEFSELVRKSVNTVEECVQAYKENMDLFQNVQCLSVSLGKEGSVLLTKGNAFSFSPLLGWICRISQKPVINWANSNVSTIDQLRHQSWPKL